MAGDLAYAQSNTDDLRVLDHLNDLVARGHAFIYASERKKPGEILRDIVYEAPGALRRRMGYIGFATGVMALGVVVGALLQRVDASWMDTVLPEPLQWSVEVWKSGRFPETTGTEKFGFMTGLNLNNSWVCILLLASGLTYGLLTSWILALNGMVLGMVSVEIARSGQLLHFLSGIVLHGVAEFAAILISGGGAYALADSLLRPGERPRTEALRIAGLDCFWMIALALLLLVFAAVLEAYVSHSWLPREVKAGLAFLLLLLLVTYVYGLRR